MTRLEDEALLAAVGQGELDLAVQAARAQQRGIQRVGAVGRHDDLDVHCLVKAIHLVQQLHEDALHLPVFIAKVTIYSLCLLYLIKQTEKSHE